MNLQRFLSRSRNGLLVQVMPFGGFACKSLFPPLRTGSPVLNGIETLSYGPATGGWVVPGSHQEQRSMGEATWGFIYERVH